MNDENEITIATHNGSKVAREHNRRNPSVVRKEDHIDPNGHFEIWLDKDPRAEYERIFGQAVKEYNSKQTKEDRKISDYYDYIRKDEKKHEVYEMIVGIYGKGSDGSPICSKEEGKLILRAFFEDWQKRNPSLELIGAYYHADEEGQPHVHLDYICVGSGYTKGLQKRSSCTKALQQMGFKAQGRQTEQMQWQARENQFLGELCGIRGFTVLHPGSKEHLATKVYKAKKELDELSQKLDSVNQEIGQKGQELQSVTDDLETAKARRSLSQVVQEVMQQPEKQIEVERIPGRKNPITRQETPAKVVLLESDYEELRQRAQSSSWLRKAMTDLRHMGERLTRELNQRRRVVELQEQASRAEERARSFELKYKHAKGQIAVLQEDVSLQQDFMRGQVDRAGKSMWERFQEHLRLIKFREREIDFIELERE